MRDAAPARAALIAGRRRAANRTGQSLILGEMEYFFACPYCSERISMVLDTWVKRQTYIEDCEVCCRPIEVRYTVEVHEVCEFEARAG
jgi:transcription elongation factor Elf1